MKQSKLLIINCIHMNTSHTPVRRFSRNYILIAIAVLTTVYGLFLASAFHLRVYSIGVLVLLIPFFEIRSHQVIMQLFILLFICLQVSSISVFDRLPYQLLISSQPFWPAVQRGLPLALGSCLLVHLIFRKKTSIARLYGIQLPIMIAACTWYVRMLLIMNNCQHIPNAKAVRLPAVVVQKCPACCDIHELWLSLTFEGKQQTVPIDVHPQLHERTKEGDTLRLTMHPGVYGWPWYHKDIKRRYE